MPTPDPHQEQYKPALLGLPNDVFGIIVTDLDRSTLARLRRTCQGLYASSLLEQAVYRNPITIEDWDDSTLAQWEFSSAGRSRWEQFKDSVNDRNRNYVQSMAVSHWSSLDDFTWIEQNLPQVTTLDLSDVRDFVWNVDPDKYRLDNIWSWTELAETCLALFLRTTHLKLFDWTDFNVHEKIRYRYSSKCVPAGSPFRLSRRESPQGIHTGSVADILNKICPRLERLSLTCASSPSEWGQDSVHDYICTLVDPIIKHAPSTLKHIQLRNVSAPLRTLISRLAQGLATTESLSITVGLGNWMQWSCERMKQGVYSPLTRQPRSGAVVFRQYPIENCDRDHESEARRIVDESTKSFGDFLRHMALVREEDPKVLIGSHDRLDDLAVCPINLVDAFEPSLGEADVFEDAKALESIHWLRERMGWRPTFSWDTFMEDGFPHAERWKLYPVQSRTFADDIMDKVAYLFQNLRKHGVPVSLRIGYDYQGGQGPYVKSEFFRPMQASSAWNRKDSGSKLWRQCEARFGLSHIADMVDELTIGYQFNTPGFMQAHRRRVPLDPRELNVLTRESDGWRKFWARYATRLRNLKKLRVVIPRIIFEDWAMSPALQALFADDSWDMLDLDHEVRSLGTRAVFVKRIFFRRGPYGAEPPPLDLPNLIPSTNAHVPMINETRGFYDDIELCDVDPGAAFYDRFFKRSERSSSSSSKKKRKRAATPVTGNGEPSLSEEERAARKARKELSESRIKYMDSVRKMADADANVPS
ncbi:hypothetical protein EJ05DRAFT_476025 [Pseudovirgaria hyperparasitica]|uniref:F-box domain-containing protein n=1 Tax=Pseudovirgaria hyperparasitica TaxID=470096 RepID=A0A6A6W7U8_9PEZI|nr:uncharacterized protein EJ05DRAFT_476025 [Pseudovirgaria hyperparasitica]KAF2758713.1 hypothetical protein EJ05DRAFT_476025 [Pseudovirgaria hyperparasitica]